MTDSVYIHIPFCKSKCKYCSFVSVCDTSVINEYADALINEIADSYKLEELKTLYIGGGTPSVLPLKIVERIIKSFNLTKDTEVTFEINPDDADYAYLGGLKKTGINRLSFGVQTFDDTMLRNIGRRHNSAEVLNALKISRKAEFENINIDLIYGLPGQTSEKLAKDLDIISDLDITHISTYGLKIEVPSFFYYNPVTLPDDDTQAEMYLQINNKLETYNYKRYEISNFSKKGYESRHNLNYWNNAEYYGFGAAAHGYLNGIRYSNSTDIAEYINNPLKHDTEHIVSLKEKLEETENKILEVTLAVSYYFRRKRY